MSPLLNYTLSAHETLHVASSVCEGDVVMRSVCETAEKRLYMSMPQAACARRFWWVSLPRPVFDMASGTSFIIRNHTKETSPLFQARRVSEYADPDTIDGSAAELPDSIREAARAAQPRVVFKRSGVSISD